MAAEAREEMEERAKRECKSKRLPRWSQERENCQGKGTYQGNFVSGWAGWPLGSCDTVPRLHNMPAAARGAAAPLLPWAACLGLAAAGTCSRAGMV